MRGRVVVPALALAACGHPVAPAPQDLASLGAPALHAMSAATLEATTRFLSSDDLEGRGTGTPGGEKAEAYVADRFKELGLHPLGDGGTYYQFVPMHAATLGDASLVVHLAAGDVTLDPKSDVLLIPFVRNGDVSIDAPLAFVGYGISRPDLGYDDLAGVDVTGKIAVVFAGAPRTLAGKPVDSALHAILTDSQVKAHALAAKGAVAMLIVYDPVRAEVMPYAAFRQVVPTQFMAWVDGDQVGSGGELPSAVIDVPTLDRLLPDGAPRGHDLWQGLDQGQPPRVELTATASLRLRSTVRDRVGRNIVAELPGSDPKLAGERVVFSAHLDHLGIGAPVDGDAIYNGALDDAIGVAGVIEIARGFAALPTPPRRTILFLVDTGEEAGLVGSDYFAHHPIVPADAIVADINLDSLTPTHEAFDMVPLGAEHSTLAASVAAAASATGLKISPDPMPEQVFFIRSDQYSFVKVGVPSLFPNAGYLDAHGDSKANRDADLAWMKAHYHKPSDVWMPDFNAAWAIKEAGFDLLVGLAVANADARPTWNAGDPFAAFAKR